MKYGYHLLVSKLWKGLLLLLISVVTSNILYAQPAVQSSLITFETIEASSFTVRFTKGDGEKRAVFIKEGSSGTVSPIDNTTYAPAANYGVGAQVGSSGWFCVLNGSDSIVNISGLVAFTDYTVMAIEYNGAPGSEKYLLATASNNPNTQQSGELSPPEFPTTNFKVSDSTSYSVNLRWTNGTGAKRIILMKLTSSTTENPSPANYTYYVPASKFGLGSEVGSGWYCVYNAGTSTAKIDSLLPDTTYRAVIIDYNGDYQKEVYKIEFSEENTVNFRTEKLEPPSVQSVNINANILRPDAIFYSIETGNGEKRAVFITDGSSNEINLSDSISYTASKDFGSGTEINGWYCISNYGYSERVENLNAESNYRIASFEYNGPDGKQRYNTTQNANNIKTFTTSKDAPSIQVSDLIVTEVNDTAVVSWVNGNGENTVVYVKQTGTDSYTPNDYSNPFVNKSCLTDIKGKWNCVYKGNGTTFKLAQLPRDTTFRFLAFSYNNGDYAEKFNTTITANENQFNFDFSKFEGTFTLENEKVRAGAYATKMYIDVLGSCSSKTIWVKETASNTDYPTLVDNSAYTADSVFGNGSEIDGWYCVYNGTKNYRFIWGLTPNTAYRIYACNYVNEKPANRLYNNSLSDNALNIATLDNVLYGYSSSTSGWDPQTIPGPDDNINILGGYIDSELSVNNINQEQSCEIWPGGHLTVNGSISQAANVFFQIFEGGTIIHSDDNTQAFYEKVLEFGEWNPVSNPMKKTYTSTSYNLFIKAFDEDETQDWKYLENLPSGVGAIAYSNQYLNMKGSLQTNAIAVPLTFTPGHSFAGFNLIGNPYPANLDWNDVSWDKSAINGSYWIYKPTEGNYASYNGTIGTLGANQYIPVAQSFWVKTTQNTSLSIPLASRSHSDPGFKNTEILSHISIKARANDFSDESIVAFSEDAILGMDAMDAEKFDGALHAPQLYTIIGEDKLSVNYLPESMLNSKQYIPLMYSCTQSGTHQLEINASSFSHDLDLLFVDKKEQISYLLDTPVTIDFAYETGDDLNRFYIEIKPKNTQVSIG